MLQKYPLFILSTLGLSKAASSDSSNSLFRELVIIDSATCVIDISADSEVSFNVPSASLSIDTLGAATDNTDLNATASAHGLCPKLSGISTEYLNGTGSWTVPAGGSGVSFATVMSLISLRV